MVTIKEILQNQNILSSANQENIGLEDIIPFASDDIKPFLQQMASEVREINAENDVVKQQDKMDDFLSTIKTRIDNNLIEQGYAPKDADGNNIKWTDRINTADKTPAISR